MLDMMITRLLLCVKHEQRDAGHSLGGAMANLAAVDVTNMMTWASVKVYTVGAPRAGNHAYASMYNKLVPDTWSIINYRVICFCKTLEWQLPCDRCTTGQLVTTHWLL